MRDDLRSPIAKARDRFMNSNEGKRLYAPVSIGAPERVKPFLRNRIEAAFIAGWNARDQENSRESE